ncbi:enoyl-CoA hydratase family protein [Solihabitans fulvus]|uniref:Enoyl-CoA hydratase family protein n=1 Tax=Solihabitans fulvus TaxID=1892852 RepID=A0A5B2WPY3_9PSEU|nr:enoyl-CoA hydratase family protein [Solihabitans fulvus]KAA2252586.1 enoyl-CoA hydratase family protein [Solihabitans fulvus]
MGVSTERDSAGIAVITVDYPPVNALPARGWFDLAEALRLAGRDERTRVVVLAAEGRGFNAGVDLKELAADPGHAALLAVNRGCHEAFRAVYECEVPVVSAVQGFCLGGGIGLVGNSDVVIAATDAVFGLPEVARGALGAATHLSRLVPQHTARAMLYTGATVGAEELRRFGSVWRVVPRDELLGAATEFAAEIAARDPLIIRRAKESLNGIDPVDVNRSYRYEQGFTFELSLDGVADRTRRAFVDGESS